MSRLIDSLQAPYTTRLQAELRSIVHDSNLGDQERSDEIALFISRHNLEPVPPPPTLPVIAVDDIHLLAWIAIVPGDGDGLAHNQ